MSNWNEVRSLAREWHRDLSLSNSGLVPADVLLAAAAKASGVRLLPLPANDILLDGAEAAYDDDGQRILYSSALPEDVARFYIAHEFGHYCLHNVKASCGDDDLDASTPAEPEESAVGEGDAYSPKQRSEAPANLFAREFLIPRDKLRARCEFEKMGASTVAVELGIPENFVLQQMADALLLPDEPARQPPKPVPEPDPSQLQAITAAAGPRQVRAGPGTGKTRTLVSRIGYLLDRGEKPKSILALTYSNESSQDLAVRIRAAVGERSAGIWTGTFHAFGLELLRRYWTEIGPNDVPKLLDRSEALFLLEELLPELDLNFYLDLYEPLRALKSVLGAIGRAKDELCGPQRYFELASAMSSNRQNHADTEAATKALEVAQVYRVYDEALRSRGLLDFGDLISRTVELMRSRPTVASEIRGEFRHVLVDEYQDVNHASGELLRELVEPGQGPWVVGDVKQSIYRFRGASPLNMSRFGSRFPGAQHTDLAVNYRSGGKIVRTFEAFGLKMQSAHISTTKPLKAYRGDNSGRVDFNVAASREAEFEGIARRITAHEASGGALRDNAILARSHSTLVKLSSHLERAGIASLYFGDFFERSEIRDLLCLMSVASEREGVGLVRVGQWSRYRIPVTDILSVLRWANEADLTLFAALKRLSDIKMLSTVGLRGLHKLVSDLADVAFMTSPHRILADYLFNRGGVFDEPLSEPSVAGQQRRLAVYQLLQVAYQYRAPVGRDPKREFLQHVRRLEILDEEKDLRKLPAAASGINAVRLMTVHASKGLEFPVVHIPSLSPSLFPAATRFEPCPAPADMIDNDPLMSKDAEEQSLFFVALSRARDVLGLSRANAYGGWSRPNPSPLLEAIANQIPKAGTVRWSDEGRTAPSFKALAVEDPLPDEISVQAIEVYQKCPRKFYYENVLGLKASSPPGPYLRFLSAIRSGLKWLRETPTEARAAGIDAQFAQSWEDTGPTDHAHAPVYRATARRMLETAHRVMDGASLPADRTMSIGTHKVLALADNVQLIGGRIVIQRLKSGRLAKRETPRTRDQLLQAMVTSDHPGNEIKFEHVSLLTGEKRPGGFNADSIKKGREEVHETFEAIAKGRFDPRPNDRDCPTCPYYFICPSSGSTI